MSLRKIEPVSDGKFKPAVVTGQAGDFKWLAPDELVIDTDYQRDVGGSGKRNIKQIVERFDWAMFSPLIVSPRPDGKFAVIDGQHRAIAGITHGGIKKLPCYVIHANREKQARAFAVINGQVTAVNPLSVFRANVVAGDPRAVATAEVAKAAGVTILERANSSAALKVGQTQSPDAIRHALDWFGRDTILAALKCIVAGDDDGRQLRATTISAFAQVLARAPAWLAHKGLLDAIKAIGVRNVYQTALLRQSQGGNRSDSHSTLTAIIARVLAEELIKRLGRCEFVPLPPTPKEKAHAAERERRKVQLKAERQRQKVERAADRAAEAERRKQQRASERERLKAEKATAKPKPKPSVATRTSAVQKAPVKTIRRDPDVGSAPKSRSLPDGNSRPNIAPAAKVSADTRELIDEHLRTKGARRFETGATGNVSILVEWLNRVAKVPAQVISTMKDGGRGIYMVRGKRRNLDGLIAVVNEERAKLKLPPLTKEKAA